MTILKVDLGSLRIRAMHEAKNSKICNFWTFWPVNHLFKIRQKAFLLNSLFTTIDHCSKKCLFDYKKMV